MCIRDSNKIDTVEKEDLLAVMDVYGQAHEWDAVVPISARTGDGVDELLEVLSRWLPEGPQLFPGDMVTDQPEPVSYTHLGLSRAAFEPVRPEPSSVLGAVLGG